MSQLLVGILPLHSVTAPCILQAIFTSLPQPLVAVPAFMFVESFKSFHPLALGFASGSMLFMVFVRCSRRPLMPLAL
jgi:zinc transporter ZupT